MIWGVAAVYGLMDPQISGPLQIMYNLTISKLQYDLGCGSRVWSNGPADLWTSSDINLTISILQYDLGCGCCVWSDGPADLWTSSDNV